MSTKAAQPRSTRERAPSTFQTKVDGFAPEFTLYRPNERGELVEIPCLDKPQTDSDVVNIPAGEEFDTSVLAAVETKAIWANESELALDSVQTGFNALNPGDWEV
jgi:hypothetical protein